MMKWSTWKKDSHGLFDYETSNIETGDLIIEGNRKITRKGENVSYTDINQPLDKDEINPTKGLANISIFKEKYWIYKPTYEKNQEDIYLVLRNYIGGNGEPGIRLSQGDCIRMGRCVYIVKEIAKDVNLIDNTHPEGHEESKDVAEHRNSTLDIVSPIDFYHENPEEKEECKKEEAKNENEIRCRICLGEDNEVDNPIILSPCQCLGSIRYIHSNCLQQWLKSKVVERKTDIFSSYHWKTFECDVCKSTYPSIKIYNYRQTY